MFCIVLRNNYRLQIRKEGLLTSTEPRSKQTKNTKLLWFLPWLVVVEVVVVAVRLLLLQKKVESLSYGWPDAFEGLVAWFVLIDPCWR